MCDIVINYDYLDNIVKESVNDGIYSVKPMIEDLSKIMDDKYGNSKYNKRIKQYMVSEIKTCINGLLCHLKRYKVDNDLSYKILCYHMGRLDLYHENHDNIVYVDVDVYKEFKKDIKGNIINTILHVNVDYCFSNK